MYEKLILLAKFEKKTSKMSFLNNLKKVFHLGGGEAKKKRLYNNIRMDTDPTEFWEMIGELGDGAFGKVSSFRFSSRCLEI